MARKIDDFLLLNLLMSGHIMKMIYIQICELVFQLVVCCMCMIVIIMVIVKFLNFQIELVWRAHLLNDMNDQIDPDPDRNNSSTRMR